jgi:nucleotide-binding universal stress UspA family protein
MKILAASDLSPQADEAIRQADEWAASVGAELIVCHAFDPTGERHRVEALTDQLIQRVESLTGRAPGQFRIELERGTPNSAIRRKAEQTGADIIVVGNRGLAGQHRLTMGSVSRHVVERAHCSVLVARAHRRTGEVLAATDLSDPSLPAIRAGASEAQRRRANLTVLHNFDVWSASELSAESPLSLAGVPVSPKTGSKMLRARAAHLGYLVLQMGIQAETVVTHDLPETAILDAARRLPAELIVIGTHGRTGLARLALGSVASAVLEDAACWSSSSDSRRVQRKRQRLGMRVILTH